MKKVKQELGKFETMIENILPFTSKTSSKTKSYLIIGIILVGFFIYQVGYNLGELLFHIIN